MIRAIRPSAVARDDASLITGWNIAPNVGYTVTLSATTSAVVIILSSADGSALIGSGLALVGTDQPVIITPMTGQTIGMVDADLGWHLLVTASGTEGERSIVMDPMVDLADEIHPIYTDDGMALARATAAINSGACYVDDVSVACPLGIGGGIGDVASAPVDGVAVVGQVESVTWSGTPDGTSETAVIRRHTAIAPEVYTPPPAPPVLADDTAETDAATATSGNVLANDASGLTVTAVNGLSANVGQIVAGSDGGEFVVNADGSWTFDPSGDFAALSGSDTATTSVAYHASNGASEASATLTITVSSAGAQPWTPAEITTALWLDAADSSTITLNGSTVSKWRDKSGNARHATQAKAASAPTKIADGVQFDGIDDYMSMLVPQTLGQQIVAVIDTTNTQTGSRVFLNRTYTGSPYPAACYLGAADGAYHNYPSIFWGVKWQNHYPSAVKRNAIFGFSILSGSTEIRIDGGAADTASTVQTVLGAWNEISTVPTYGQQAAFVLKELVIYNGTSAIDRQKVEGYLAHKWGLEANLPAGHTYKSAPPTI